MMLAKLFAIMGILPFATLTIAHFQCETVFVFRTHCVHYEFKDRCQPWKLDECKPLHISFYTPNCPVYHCTEVPSSPDAIGNTTEGRRLAAIEASTSPSTSPSTTSPSTTSPSTTSPEPTPTTDKASTTILKPTPATAEKPKGSIPLRKKLPATPPSTSSLSATTAPSWRPSTPPPLTITSSTTPAARLLSSTASLASTPATTPLSSTTPGSYLPSSVASETFSSFPAANHSPKMLTSFDCPNMVCELVFVWKNECIIYLNETENCMVPCQLENCPTTIQESIECPQWVCSEKSTTASPPTTPFPPGPSPTSSSCSTNATCITSLSFNGIFLVALFALCLLALKKTFWSPVPNQNILNASSDDVEHNDVEAGPEPQLLSPSAATSGLNFAGGVVNPLAFVRNFSTKRARTRQSTPVGLDANVVAADT